MKRKKRTKKELKHFEQHLKIHNIVCGKGYMIIAWNCKNIGFGECSFSEEKDGRRIIDDECMGMEFVRILCSKIADFYGNIENIDTREANGTAKYASPEDIAKIYKLAKAKKAKFAQDE